MSTSTTTNYINAINVLYPVAGADNNSQGFRDNFSNIANALGSAKSDINELQLNSVRTDQTNNFNSSIIQQAQFQDCSVTLYDGTGVVETGNVMVDYTNGSYQKFSISGGTHNFSVTNWPGTDQSASMLLAVTTASISNTYINFTDPNVTNLSSDKFPFQLTEPHYYIFEIIHDGAENRTFVKKLNDRILRATTLDVNAENVTGTNIIALEDLVIGANTYRVDSKLSTVVTATYQSQTVSGRMALLPTQAFTTVTNNEVPLNGSTSTTTFNIVSSQGILLGATFSFTGTNTVFSVTGIDANTISTQAFTMTQRILSDGDSIIFTNPRFANQPVLLSLADAVTSSTTAQFGELKGQVYATSSSVYITYDDYAPQIINKVQVATIDQVNAIGGTPIGGIILWYGSTGSVPSGWHLCDGTNGTPDLRGMFVVGAGGTYSVGATGGSADAVVVSHTHNINDPGHHHAYTQTPIDIGGFNINANPGVNIENITASTEDSVTGITVDTIGVSGTNANLPPYHALCYIMRVA